MDAGTISAIFPYALGGVGILGSAVIALCGWFIKKLLDDNSSLRCKVRELEKDFYSKYEGLQSDNTKIKIELEHIRSQQDVLISELQSCDTKNNTQHAEFYERLRIVELQHNSLLIEHNCIKDSHKI